MRLEETCSCGASLVLVWNQPRNRYDTDGISEAARAKEELKTWRLRHKRCGVAVDEKAAGS